MSGGPVRIHPAGQHALLIEVGDSAEAIALAEWVRGRVAATEVVPAARTVLLDGVSDPETARETVTGWAGRDAAPQRRRGQEVEIPVVYDGPDLESVADLWGTDAEGVVERHTTVAFVSAFCGFAPGFAYLAGLPDDLAVPRRESPRPRVPAGSVALADVWCGVYPSDSPGGWQLLGRTDLTLWDEAQEPPALLPPGTPVRFVAR